MLAKSAWPDQGTAHGRVPLACPLALVSLCRNGAGQAFNPLCRRTAATTAGPILNRVQQRK
eukprot:11207073-Lingulodinium_polyedra.AAC.1